MIRAVLFDFDDTLIDWHATHLGFCRFFAKKYAALSGDALEEAALMMSRWGVPTGEWADEAAARWGGFTREGIIQERLDRLHEFTVTKEGMAKTLSYLRPKYRMGIVTNGIGRVQHRRIEALGLPRWFDCVIASGDIGIAKPDPRIFRQCLKKLGVEAGEAVFVGDDFVNDIQGSLSCGMSAIRMKVPGFEDGKSARGVREITRLAELMDML